MLSSAACCKLAVCCSSPLQKGSWRTLGELAPVLAAVLNLVGLLQPLHLGVSNVSLISLNLMGFQCFHFLNGFICIKGTSCSLLGTSFQAF